MKTLVMLIALACSGCFTSWAAMQVSGRTLAWDEQVRQEIVPVPGVHERLTLALPLSGDMRLECRTAQYAKDAVYRSSFRYGKGWKRGTALMFAAEAAAASLYLLAGTTQKDQLYGAFFAVDAIGTAALFFVPRKESFRRTEVEAKTTVREDCPDGLLLEVAGTTYPVDAAGRIGEAGEVAVEDWLSSQSGPLLVSLAGRTAELRSIGTPQVVYALIEVPTGTLTALAQ